MTLAESPLWQPSDDRISAANITRFMGHVNSRFGVSLAGYDDLYNWSLAARADFWEALWDFSGVIGDKGPGPYLRNGDQMPGAAFFPEAKINFAENLLRRTDDSDAMVFWSENKIKRRLSYGAVYGDVSKLAQALSAAGVSAGDRVAAFMPNMPETVIAMLATAALGAVWSSCSPDFGTQGVLDRFGQIEPKVLIAVEGYHYNGKDIDVLDKVADVAAALPSLSKVIVVSHIRQQPAIDGVRLGVHLADFTAAFGAKAIAFQAMRFNDPLYIMFSSGTTGVPKCIVHGIGGTLLQHLKEHSLQSDVKAGDRVFYFTTCGWMMWNWLVSALAVEATLLLYDGSPFYPDGNILFDYADAEAMTLFGTSAKYIDACNKAGLTPKDSHSLASVRTMASTGSPLVPEGFDYVYENVKTDICLSSIAGGTDIVSCFVLGNPIGPVWRGEIQKRGLGMQVEVWDDDGNSLIGEKGELVCSRAFPSMPIMFWNDPDGRKYHAAYFDKFPNVWCHGDYVALTEHGGMIIYGRSDAVLNPGGVRIGTAEIYRQVEQIDDVTEGLVIGQQWQGDVRVVLFVTLRPGRILDETLIAAIKSRIRSGATPRHVPAKVLQVAEIPRTKSGKIVELAVRDLVHGRQVKNIEALANPEALGHFTDLEDLRH